MCVCVCVCVRVCACESVCVLMNSSHTPQVPVSCRGNASKSENHPPVSEQDARGRGPRGRCQDYASQEGRDEGESGGERGWEAGGCCQDYASREGVHVDEGESVEVWGEGMGDGWMLPRLCLPGGGR